MKLRFERSFEKDLDKINDKKMLQRVQDVLAEIEYAVSQVKVKNEIPRIRNMEKLEGYTNAYRIRIGDYRLGTVIESEEVLTEIEGIEASVEEEFFTLIRILHRKEIYKKFP